MSLTRKLGKTAVVAALGASSVVLGSGAAFAGTNGQQIEFYDQRGDVYSVEISGYNQDGGYVDHCFNTPGTDNYLSGWWWKGDVTITWYSAGSCTGAVIEPSPEVFTIPVSQSSDWYEITD